jgi:aspartate/methionine/tyrosine aminotransferase
LPTPDHIKNAGTQAIADGKTTYTNPQGILELREALCRHVERGRGVNVTPDMVYVGPGCKPAFYYVAQALLEKGDEILYPDPGFPMYPALAAVTQAKVVTIPMDAACRTFNFDVFDKAISSGKAKVLIMNSPSNPTGGVMPPEDVKRVAKACADNDVWLISDEIYSELIYDKKGDPFTSPLSMPECNKDKTIIFDGFSKTYCMTGWRLGWAVMPKALAERVALLTTHSVGCTASFTQYAGIEALDGPQDCVEDMISEYRKRRDYVVSELNSMPGVTCETPAGAFYAFPNVSSFGLSSREIADKLLAEGGVALLPGTDFGASGEGFIRFSYVLSLDQLKEGLARVRKVVETLKK